MKKIKILGLILTFGLLSSINAQEQKAELYVQTGHTKQINQVVFTKDGRFIVSGSDDETVKLWNADSGEELRTFGGLKGRVSSIAILPDGKTIAAASNSASTVDDDGNPANSVNSVVFWDIITGKMVKQLKVSQKDYERIESFAVSPDGSKIAVILMLGVVKLFDIASEQELKTVVGEASSSFPAISFSPDGKFLAACTGGENQGLVFWDASSGQVVEGSRSF